MSLQPGEATPHGKPETVVDILALMCVHINTAETIICNENFKSVKCLLANDSFVWFTILTHL